MGRPKSLDNISKTLSAAVEAEGKPGVSEAKNCLSSLPAELHLAIVDHLPRTSLPTICRLNRHWCWAGTDELLRRLLPIPHLDDGTHQGAEQLKQAICHFIDTNSADALQRLLDLRPTHPYFPHTKKSLLQAVPESLRRCVTKDEEERFCLDSDWSFPVWAVDAAIKFNDMSCMQRLIDHGIVDYRKLLDCAVYDGFAHGLCYGGWLARPFPAAESRGSHNPVLDWLLAYPPRHVVQALLVMWGEPILHPRLQPLCDWYDWNPRDCSGYCDMLILAAGCGHPASQQKIGELRLMVDILTDDASGNVIPEARQSLSRALRIARGMASMWPGAQPLVVEYLLSVCTYEGRQNRSSGSNDSTNNLPPPPAPPLILPPQDPLRHRLIDLKTYDGMLEPENWLELERVHGYDGLLWLVSTEFLADEDAARRMRCFEQTLCELNSRSLSTYNLLIAASAFRRWRCVEVVLGELRGRWPKVSQCFLHPDWVLCRAIIDAVQGEPGCADGCTIRKLLRTGTRNREDYKGFGFGEDLPNEGPFRGGWFGWEPFRLAFVEQQQDREQRETQACMDMRDAILDALSISDQNALDFLVGEPSKALFRASKRRLLKRSADKRDSGRGAGSESSCGERSSRSTTPSRSVSSSGSS